MGKLLAAFDANPNAKTAGRVAAYIYKHPFCIMVATDAQLATIKRVRTEFSA